MTLQRKRRAIYIEEIKDCMNECVLLNESDVPGEYNEREGGGEHHRCFAVAAAVRVQCLS